MGSLQPPTRLEECLDAQKMSIDSKAQAIDYCELVNVQAGLLPPSVCCAVYDVLLIVHTQNTHRHRHTHTQTHRQPNTDTHTHTATHTHTHTHDDSAVQCRKHLKNRRKQ